MPHQLRIEYPGAIYAARTAGRRNSEPIRRCFPVQGNVSSWLTTHPFHHGETRTREK